MAIQFARLEYVSRSTGGNACRKAAYNERSVVECDRTGQVFNFSKKQDNVFHEILLPSSAHEKFKDASVLWNEAEKCEKRINSQVCKDVVLALPKEECVTLEHKIKIAKEFVEQEFVSKGLAAQLDIHAPHEENDNWHAHVLITTRYFDKSGETFDKKARDLDPVVRFKKVQEAENLGLKFKEFQEQYAQRHNLDFKVDEIGIHPQEHLGPVRLRKKGSDLIKGAIQNYLDNKKSAYEAREVLEHLTRTSSVFSEKELDLFLQKHAKDSHQGDLKNTILKSDQCIKLMDSTSKTFSKFYTTQTVLEEEKFLNRLIDTLQTRQVNALEVKKIEHLCDDFTLSIEQQVALKKVSGSDTLCVIEGRAGVGKSHTLKAIHKSFESQKVIALAPTHSVVKDLKNDGFDAHTVHSFLFKVKNQKMDVLKNSVLVMDEAAMVQNSAMIEVLKIARDKKLKTILVGDDRQLLSVERGGAFELIKQKVGSVVLSQIRRQEVDWQKEVSQLLSVKKTYEAVQVLNDNKALIFNETLADSITSLVKEYAKEKDPSSCLVLSFKNDVVDSLNKKIQDLRHERGEISSDFYALMTPTGVQKFAQNDRVIFSITDKKLGLTNGESGVITEINEKKCVVSFGETQKEFDPSSYQGLRLNYASTIHKSQGKTAQKAYVLHDPLMGSRLSYVGLSRQKTNLKVFVSKTQTKSLSHLSFQLEKSQQTPLSLHFLTENELLKTLEQPANPQTLFDRVKDEFKQSFNDLKTSVMDRFHTNSDFYTVSKNTQKTVHKVEKVDPLRMTTIEEKSGEKTTNTSPHSPTTYTLKRFDARLNDFRAQNQERLELLTQNIHDVATKLYGSDYKRTSKSLRFGNKGSVEVFTSGEKRGLYSNYETNVHGNVYTLIEQAMGYTSFSQTLLWAKNYLSVQDPSFYQRPSSFQKPQQTTQKAQDKWHQVNAPTSSFPNIFKDKYLSYMTKDKTLKDYYEYSDSFGKTLGFVVRLEDKQGAKITPTLTYHRHESGLEAWRWKGFGNNRPLYNLKEVSTKKEAPVLIVEGEKTANAAKQLFKDHVVVTWSGGVGAVLKTDFKPLKNRDITIWPDNDTPGFKCALLLKEHLLKEFKTPSKVVDVPDSFDKKWDLADALPKGFDIKDIQTLLKTSISEDRLLEKSEGVFSKDLQKTNHKVEDTLSKENASFEFKGHDKNWTKQDIYHHVTTNHYDDLGTPKAGFCGLVERVEQAYKELIAPQHSDNFDHSKLKDLSIFTSMVFQEQNEKLNCMSPQSLDHLARAFDRFKKTQEASKISIHTQSLKDLFKQTEVHDNSSNALSSILSCLTKDPSTNHQNTFTPSQIETFQKTMTALLNDHQTFKTTFKEFDQTREFSKTQKLSPQLEKSFERVL